MSDVIEKILAEVDIYDLLDAATPPVKYLSRVLPHNISCPFHGADNSPSFRVYPDTQSAHCYTCDKSWDQISLWAQLNEWWHEDGTLDMGRSIADLCRRYNIRSIRPNWRKGIEENLAVTAKKRKGYQGVPFEDREKLRTTYIYRIARLVKNIPDDERAERWEEIREMWDSLDSLDLHQDVWMSDLRKWGHDAHWVFGILQGLG